MPVLLKAALDRSGGSRSALPALASSENKKSGESNVAPQYLSAVVRQNTTASASSRKSGLSANCEVTAKKPVAGKWTVYYRVKWFYKHCHINYLLPLIFVMLYMFVGAIIFLWLEWSVDDAKKQADYHRFVHEKELLVKRMEEIITDLAADKPGKRKFFIEEAVDYFHSKVGFSVSNKTDWSLVTALYYSGTLFTTIG